MNSKCLLACLLVLFSIGCEFDRTNNADSSNHKLSIELGQDKDTITKLIYDDAGRLKFRIPYQHNVKNGIRYEYDDAGRVVDESLFVNDTLVSIALHHYSSENLDTLIKFFSRAKDSMFVEDGSLSFDERGIIADRSYYYRVVRENDTINHGDDFSFALELVLFDLDSVFAQVSLGGLDSKRRIGDTISWVSGWSKKFKFTVQPERLGYNYLTGNIIVIGIYPEHKDYGVDTLLFYTDYYVN